MARQRTRNALKRNAQGTARPFIAGLQNARLTALDSLEWQAFTEVAGLNVEKTDNTTITLPSDTDGFQLDEVTTGYGGLQQQTSTLTEYMDERQNAGFIPGVKRDLPFSLWLPQGRGRQLSDQHDFKSGTLLDLAYLQSDNQDDNANASDGDVANPNKISVGISYHGRNRHTIRAAQFTSPTPATDFEKPLSGVTFIQNREDTGSIARRWFVLEEGDTSEKPDIHERNKFGSWESAVEFGEDDDKPRKLYENAGYLYAAGGATNVSHFYIDPDNVASAARVVDGNTTKIIDDNTIAYDIFVKSSSELFVVGGGDELNDTGDTGRIILSTDPLKLGAQVGDDYPMRRLNAIDGFGDQIVVVGAERTVFKGAYSATGRYEVDDIVVNATKTYVNITAITANEAFASNKWTELTGDAILNTGVKGEVLISEDGGATFTRIEEPPDGSRRLNTVFQTDVDTFWVGDDQGNVWWTYNFGKSWVQGSTSIPLDSIEEIKFLWPRGSEQASRVGYLVGRSTNSSGNSIVRVLRTIDGGNTWRADDSYISQFDRGTRAATTIWNQLAVAGPQSVMIAGNSNGGALLSLVEYE